MKVGVTIPHNTGHASIETIDRLLAAADGAGWASIWAQDHIVFPRQVNSVYPYGPAGTSRIAAAGQAADRPPLPWWELGSVLSYAAAKTTRVALGTAVLVLPLRHPLFVAKMMATIDRLSRGRLICGVGVGWMQEEFEALGIGAWFPARGSVSNEYLAIMRRAWNEEYAEYDGKFIKFGPVSVTPKPVQRPGPPVWIGGNGSPAWRRVARFGDGWMPLAMRRDEISAARQGLAAELAAVGRELSSVTLALRRRVLLDGFTPAVPADASDRNSYLMGSVDEVVSEIRGLAAAGVSHLIVDPWVTPSADEALALAASFAENVVPEVGGFTMEAPA